MALSLGRSVTAADICDTTGNDRRKSTDRAHICKISIQCIVLYANHVTPSTDDKCDVFRCFAPYMVIGIPDKPRRLDGFPGMPGASNITVFDVRTDP